MPCHFAHHAVARGVCTAIAVLLALGLPPAGLAQEPAQGPPPAEADSSGDEPPAEAGSAFAPPADAGSEAGDLRDDTLPLSDDDLPLATEEPGMSAAASDLPPAASAFPSPPAFGQPASPPPTESAPESPQRFQSPQSYGAPQNFDGPQDVTGPAFGSTQPPAFGGPAAADGTRSVLTSPPAGDPLLAEPAASSLPLPNEFDQTVAATNPPAVLPTGPATELLEQAATPVEPGGRPVAAAGLGMRPLPLLEALERSGDRGRRLWITQAYWNVAEQAVVLRWTADAAERLELVAPGSEPHDRATLDVAIASRLADVAAAKSKLVSAQQELVDLVRLPASEPLPWPVDQPLTTSYETHFDVLFASRIATGRIRAINRALPLQHEELEARAAAVLAAETALEMAEHDHARARRPIESVIAAHETLLTQQRALAAAVTRYNDDIVEYVMAVADLSVPDDRFASMLIATPTPWRPSGVVPAGAIGLPPSTAAIGSPEVIVDPLSSGAWSAPPPTTLQ